MEINSFMKSDRYHSYTYYIQQFNQAKTEAEQFIVSLDERTFRRKPSANVWCIGECFSHLIETGTLYYQKGEQGIKKAKKPGTGAKKPMHLRFHMQWFVNYLEPPVSVKSKTPGAFQPVEYARLDKDEVLNNYLTLQDQYITQLKMAKTNKLDLSSIKVPNPVITLIKMTVAECIAVTEAHQRRHLEQAKKVEQTITGRAVITQTRS